MEIGSGDLAMTCRRRQSEFVKYLSNRAWGKRCRWEAPWVAGSSHSRGRKDCGRYSEPCAVVGREGSSSLKESQAEGEERSRGCPQQRGLGVSAGGDGVEGPGLGWGKRGGEAIERKPGHGHRTHAIPWSNLKRCCSCQSRV